jgi:hypothetical protein
MKGKEGHPFSVPFGFRPRGELLFATSPSNGTLARTTRRLTFEIVVTETMNSLASSL